MRKDLVVRAFSPGYSFLYLARETFHRPRQVGARKDTYTHTRLPRCALTSPPTLTLSPTPPPHPRVEPLTPEAPQGWPCSAEVWGRWAGDWLVPEPLWRSGLPRLHCLKLLKPVVRAVSLCHWPGLNATQRAQGGLPASGAQREQTHGRACARMCLCSFPFAHCGGCPSWDCPGPRLRTPAPWGRSTGRSSLPFLRNSAEGLSSQDLPKHRPRCSRERPAPHASPACGPRDTGHTGCEDVYHNIILTTTTKVKTVQKLGTTK